eukprot:gene4295-6090_t
MSIERYDPIRVIGEGSFGKVYLMRDKIKRNFVCVKIIKIKNIPKKEREATKAEVDLLRRLHHPNIVRYLDSFLSKNGESLCICMEYCDGGDLASQVKAARRNLFSEGKILHWFVQLALGLHYMHSNKVLHRDLKTQNVFLLGNGRLVLGDLGISKVLDGTMDFAQTCIGTPYYMSPEIFKNKPYGYKSDVWALGCVLYEMTTLNHAFDANSLNGLATKIVKGKYPPIHAKYSRHLRELIGQMLLLNPQQRPDLDQILRKPFIKKHVIDFFTDIASRPTNSIGEGTMIVKAAAGGQVSGLGNDSNMISLRQQLHALDMTQAVQDALQPKPALAEVNDEQALRLAKEQASALKREQEHKKMVEAALEKLRLERENRVKERVELGGKGGLQRPAGYPQQDRRGNQQVQQQGNNRPTPIKQAPVQSGGPPRQVSQPSLINNNQNQPSSEAARKEYAVRDRGLNWNKKQSDDDNSSQNSARDKPKVQPAAVGGADRRRSSFGEDRDKIADRERKAAEEKKKLQQIADDKRRDEVRIEARAREEARLREEAFKLKEEALAKQKNDIIRAQAEAAARRDQLRERERLRQKEEIEQLKRDKLELDRRSNERDRIREDRRAQERDRLESLRKEQLEAQDKAGQFAPTPRSSRLSEEEHTGMSARDRVVKQKLERQAKEEAERLEALKIAEAANRKIRIDAQNQYRNIYHQQENVGGGGGGYGKPYRDPNNDDQQSRYEFDPSGRGKVRDAMDLDELNDRLNEATKGRSRYDNEQSQQYRRAVSDLGKQNLSIEHDSEEEEDDWNNEDNMINNAGNSEEEEEDLHRKEEELQAELNFATLRVNELKKTLQETKSFIGQRVGVSRGNADNGSSPMNKNRHNNRNVQPAGRNMPVEDEEDEEEDDRYGDDDTDMDENYDEEEESSAPTSTKAPSFNPSPKIADNRPINGQAKSSFGNNSNDPQGETIRRFKDRDRPIPVDDSPSTSGRLGDRIERLRHRCMEALGKDAFDDAYNFLKQHEEESQGYDNGRDMNDDNYDMKKISRIRAILGEGKAIYGGLIEQLIFMEDTHSG